MCIEKQQLKEEFEKLKTSFLEELKSEHKEWEFSVYNRLQEQVHKMAPDTKRAIESDEKRIEALEEMNRVNDKRQLSIAWKINIMLIGSVVTISGIVWSAAQLYGNVQHNTELLNKVLIPQDAQILDTKIENIEQRQTKLEGQYDKIIDLLTKQ